MAERAAAIGADFTIDSAPGAGTTVALSLPYLRRDGESPVSDAR
jgi:nitrate/nitrite-specific signal transduction histidine kinase